MVSKEDVEVLVTCKFRLLKNIRFNDVERTAAVSSFYNVQGIIVTNLYYSKKAIEVAKELGVMLTNKFDIKHKLKFYVEKEVEKKELGILENIEKDEKIYLYIYE